MLTLLFTCAEKQSNGEQKRDETVNVSVMTLTPQIFTEEGIYFGIIQPVETANLICYGGGRVEKINAFEGQKVKKGVSLARIDSERALSALGSAKAQVNITKSTLEQTKRHLQNGNSSQLAVDQQNLTYLNARSSYVDALKSYRGAFAVTPISGIVTKKFIDIFQELPPNTQTFTISRLDTIKISIGITETDIYHVDEGSKATLTIPMINGRIWYGSIKNLAKAAGLEDRVFTAEVYFGNKDKSLKPGISAKVQLSLMTYDSAVVIPTDIITTEGIQSSVMVVDSAMYAHRRFIQTGSQSDTNTFVKKGLSFGERVITDGFQLVREKTRVKIVQPGKEE
jgi:RND family efflux transporter MFP subunit